MLLLLVVFLTITQEQFATSQNFINILNTNAVLLVVSVGLTFVLLVGGFDLSLGGMLALAGVGLALLIEAGVPPLPAVLAVVAAGTLVGLVLNGWLIAGVGLSFLVVTLATSSLFASAALVITGGQSQSVFEQGLLSLGTGTWAGVPYSVWIALAVLVVAVVVLRWTGYGRMVYAVGGNPEAARLAGIDVTLVRASAYGIAGGLAALAGVLTTAQLTAASPTAGAGVALTAGAAVLLGGTTFTGGRGTMLGTLLGVLFLGVLSNGITLTGVSAFWQGIVSGIVLILALLLDRVRTRREAAG
jgi:ribose transport system permease protein